MAVLDEAVKNQTTSNQSTPPPPTKPPEPEDLSKQTVQGQMDKYLDPTTPLSQRVMKAGEMTASSRGLGNSSIAVGAATGALLDHAADMAKFDANVYKEHSLTDKTLAAEKDLQTTLQLNEHVQQKELQQLDQDFKASQAELDRIFEENQHRLSLETQVAIEDARLLSQQVLQQNQFVNDAMAQYAHAINSIDPSVSPEVYSTYVQQATTALNSRLQYLGIISGEPGTGTMSFETPSQVISDEEESSSSNEYGFKKDGDNGPYTMDVKNSGKSGEVAKIQTPYNLFNN